MEAYKRWVRRNKEYVHSLESLANGMTWLLPERFSDSEIGPEAGVEFAISAVNFFVSDMEAYKRWVRRNKEYVHSLESLANGMTWLLPERFSDSEIGPEAGFVKFWMGKNQKMMALRMRVMMWIMNLANSRLDLSLLATWGRGLYVGSDWLAFEEEVFDKVTTTLGIITAINQHIIDTAPTPMHRGSAEPYSFPYPLCISALKDLETLTEVVAQHYYGDDKKWNFIAVTEASKVLVRLALFWNSGYKMLLHGGETPNVDKQPDAFSSQHENGGFTKPGGQSESDYLMNNHAQNLEGRALSALNRFGENARMVSEPVWLRRVQQQHAIMEPPRSVVQRPTISTILSEKGLHGALFLAGEMLFITRPLIYVLFIRKYGIRSWIPWLLSLTVDFVGMGILSKVTESSSLRKEQQFHLSISEKNEVKRRKMLLALYLMRDPFFSKYTRQKLESTRNVLEPVPIIGFLSEKIVDLITGAQTRYTYMSGS
nr:peroxisome biogenesis protein 16 [Quercus suber]